MSGFATYQLTNDISYGGKSYQPTDFTNASTPEIAAEVFCYMFKKIGEEPSDLADRKAKALEFYKKYQGKTIETITGINELQLKIVQIAQNSSDYGIQAKAGYCLAWVNDVYEAAGVVTQRKCCAYCSGYYFGVATNLSNIPLGAAVYGESSTTNGVLYGHVGIYIGNGMVADNIGGVRIISLSEWCKKHPDGCWGWTSSTPVNASYPTTQGLIHAGRH